MKHLNKILILFIITTIFISCNKESIVEGIATSNTITVIEDGRGCNLASTTAGLNYDAIPFITIDDMQFDVRFTTRQFRADQYNYHITYPTLYAATDSVRQLYLSNLTNSSVKKIEFAVSVNGSAMDFLKLANGANITSTTLVNYGGNVTILYNKKPSPYTTTIWNYIGSQYTSPYTGVGNATTTNYFMHNSEGYIGFIATKINTATGGSVIKYYGWIKISLNNSRLTIDSYGYRKSKPITAGEK
jgi:hypothetical protein